MRERLTIRKRGQVTLPKSILEKFDLKEGDSLEIRINDEGELIVIPMVQVPASQKWFWSDDWQEGENEANEEMQAGDVKEFKDVYDLIEDLESDD